MNEFFCPHAILYLFHSDVSFDDKLPEKEAKTEVEASWSGARGGSGGDKL